MEGDRLRSRTVGVAFLPPKKPSNLELLRLTPILKHAISGTHGDHFTQINPTSGAFPFPHVALSRGAKRLLVRYIAFKASS